MTERKLGNRLRAVRTQHGLTQAELALMARVSPKTINTIENRGYVPSTTLALALAAALEISVEALFFLIEETP